MKVIMEANLPDSRWRGSLLNKVMRDRKLCKATSQGRWLQVSLKLSKMLCLGRLEATEMRAREP